MMKIAQISVAHLLLSILYSGVASLSMPTLPMAENLESTTAGEPFLDRLVTRHLNADAKFHDGGSKDWEEENSKSEYKFLNSTVMRIGYNQEPIHSESQNGSGKSSGRLYPFSAGRWHYAHATFYGDETAAETMQGACGYRNLFQQGYGTSTVALSSVLFNEGFACGSCFEIKCINSWACYLGSPSTTVTATNFCPANWAKPTNNGGWCNPPREHFDMSKPAFEKIAFWRAGIVPIAYRRVPCMKRGTMHFTIEGNQWWQIVFIHNVGGPGDIGQVYIRGSRTNYWIHMTHNWGVGYQVFRSYVGQSLSFMVISNSNFETVIAWNIVPSHWKFGQTFTGGQFVHAH